MGQVTLRVLVNNESTKSAEPTLGVVIIAIMKVGGNGCGWSRLAHGQQKWLLLSSMRFLSSALLGPALVCEVFVAV